MYKHVVLLIYNQASQGTVSVHKQPMFLNLASGSVVSCEFWRQFGMLQLRIWPSSWQVSWHCWKEKTNLLNQSLS